MFSFSSCRAIGGYPKWQETECENVSCEPFLFQKQSSLQHKLSLARFATDGTRFCSSLHENRNKFHLKWQNRKCAVEISLGSLNFPSLLYKNGEHDAGQENDENFAAVWDSTPTCTTFFSIAKIYFTFLFNYGLVWDLKSQQERKEEEEKRKKRENQQKFKR